MEAYTRDVKLSLSDKLKIEELGFRLRLTSRVQYITYPAVVDVMTAYHMACGMLVNCVSSDNSAK